MTEQPGGRAPLDAGLEQLRLGALAATLRPMVDLEPAAVRERVTAGNRLCSAGPDLFSVVDRTITHRGLTVPVRVYAPTDEHSDRTLVYAHGGGWVTGDLDYADEVCRFLARDAACTVVSVDYRLAPEHRFPAGLDDVAAVLGWATDGDGLVGVAGDSAGGNLVAAAVLRERDEDRPAPAFQLLAYPVLDHVTGRDSYRTASFPIGRADMEWFFDHYADPGERDRPEVSPLRAPVLSGLPRTHVVVAGHDPLHDEALAYGAALTAAGTDVTVSGHPDLCHGFLRFTAVSSAAVAARAALVTATDALFARAGVRRAASSPAAIHNYDSPQPDNGVLSGSDLGGERR